LTPIRHLHHQTIPVYLHQGRIAPLPTSKDVRRMCEGCPKDVRRTCEGYPKDGRSNALPSGFRQHPTPLRKPTEYPSRKKSSESNSGLQKTDLRTNFRHRRFAPIFNAESAEYTEFPRVFSAVSAGSAVNVRTHVRSSKTPLDYWKICSIIDI